MSAMCLYEFIELSSALSLTLSLATVHRKEFWLCRQCGRRDKALVLFCMPSATLRACQSINKVHGGEVTTEAGGCLRSVLRWRFLVIALHAGVMTRIQLDA